MGVSELNASLSGMNRGSLNKFLWLFCLFYPSTCCAFKRFHSVSCERVQE